MSNKIKFWLLVDFLWRLVAWAIIPFALLFAKKTDSNNIPYDFMPEVQRYKLPEYLYWMQPADDLLPPCLYEEACLKQYNRYGTWIASWLNLSFRNTGSIMWRFGKPSTNYYNNLSMAEIVTQGVYDHVSSIGRLKLHVGWVIYRDWLSRSTEKGFWAVNRITLRWDK